MAVAEHLHLDVASAHEQLLQVERGVAECGVGLSRRLSEHVGELVRASRHLDPATTSARRRLHHHRVAELRRGGERLVERGHAVRSRHGRNVRLAGQRPRQRLVAHALDRVSGGPDERDPLGLARRGELGVLGEEAVTGMDRVGRRLLRRLDQRVGVQVAVAGARRADADGLVGRPHVQRLLVGRRSRRRRWRDRAPGRRG